MKSFLSKQLQAILREEKNAGRLTPNEEKVFSQVLTQKQVEIFSNPKVAGPVSDLQSERIISLINSMTFFKKEDAKFRFTISPSYLQAFLEYIEDRYQAFRKDVETILSQKISHFVNDGVRQAIIVEDVKYIESIVGEFILKGSQKVNFKSFIKSINTNILDEKSQELLIDKKKEIEFFIQLLPFTIEDRFSGEKNFLNELHLENELNNQIQFLTEMYKQEIMIENDVMTLRVSFIKSSEIARVIENHGINRFKYVNVYAYLAVYFDMSLNLQNFFKMTIISPKWKVESNVVIDLSITYVPPNYPKASNAISPGSTGTDGLPGLPAQNGGQFFGFGNEFSNLGDSF